MAFEDMTNPILQVATMADPFGSLQRGQDSRFQDQQRVELQQQQAQAQQEHVQQQALQAQQTVDVQAALANPTAASFSALQARYPKEAAAYKASWETQDKAKQTADLTALGGIASAIQYGRPDLAKAQLQARIDADKAAGLPVHGDLQAMLDGLNTGTPEGLAQAKGLSHFMIATAAGPDKLSEYLNPKDANENVVLSADSRLVNKTTGAVISEARSKPVYEKVKDADGNETIVRLASDDSNGKPAAVGQGGWANFYGGFLAGTEGGYAARDGKSGAPVNFGVNQAANPDIDVSKLTQTQAATILHDRYWVPSGADGISNPALQAIVADTAVNMGVGKAKELLVKSKGDPAAYLALREQRYRALGGPDLKTWLGRNAKLADFAGVNSSGGGSGGAQVVYSNAPPAEADNGLTGQDYLNSLPDAKRGMVKMIVDGNFPITAKMTSPSVIKLFEAATRVDPSISAATYQKRLDTVKDFSSKGKSGQAIVSIETITNHMHDMAEASDALGGLDIGGKLGNYGINAFKSAMNDKALIRYNTIVAKVAPELDKFLSGKASTVSGTHEQTAGFNPNFGPSGRKEAITTTMTLLTGRLDPIGAAYSRGMNKEVNAKDLLRPAMRQKFDAVQTWANGGALEAVHGQDKPAGGAPSSAPVQITTRAQLAALAPGTSVILPDGTRTTRK